MKTIYNFGKIEFHGCAIGVQLFTLYKAASDMYELARGHKSTKFMTIVTLGVLNTNTIKGDYYKQYEKTMKDIRDFKQTAKY